MSDFTPIDCPFCDLPAERVLESNAYAWAIADAFPVSAGHSLVVPLRHVISFFELTDDEVAAVFELLGRVKDRLDGSLKPSGYNIGINIGAAAGQTVAHVHAHLIPRYSGDVANPVGGVRNVLPGRGAYAGSDS
jgi:diadenosine tetraphosphate (Ap4A) HIT family hydrolase